MDSSQTSLVTWTSVLGVVVMAIVYFFFRSMVIFLFRSSQESAAKGEPESADSNRAQDTADASKAAPPPPAELGPTCAKCGKPGSSKLCGKCKIVVYCSQACERLHWPDHKHECRKPGEKAAGVGDTNKSGRACRFA